MMNPQPSILRFHLSTGIVLMLEAAVLVFIEMSMDFPFQRTDSSSFVSPRTWNKLVFILNSLSFVMILLGTLFLLEWRISRVEKKKPVATHPRFIESQREATKEMWRLIWLLALSLLLVLSFFFAVMYRIE